MLMKAGTKRTEIINLGTALHREALSLELHTTPGWLSRRYQAIEQWPTNMPLWAKWEGLYRTAEPSPLGRGQGEGAGESQQRHVVRGSPDPAHATDRRSPDAEPCAD
jgi:hypothetical protein